MISVSVLTITPVQDYLYSSPFLTHPSEMLLHGVITVSTCYRVYNYHGYMTECIVTMVTESCKNAFVLRDEPEIVTTGIF